MTAPLGIQVGLVQVRAQQREHCPVTFGEVRPGSAAKVQPYVPPRPGGSRRRLGQAQHEMTLQPQHPYIIGVHRSGMPLPGGVEVCDLDDAAQVTGAARVAAELAFPVVLQNIRR